MQAHSAANRAARMLTKYIYALLALTCFITTQVYAQQLPSSKGLAQPRITQPIDDSDSARLPDSKPHALKNALDQGRMDPGARLQHLILVLKASLEQEHALNTLLDQQQDKTSPNYHRWLTPDDFGQQFGVAPEDLQKIADWLGRQSKKLLPAAAVSYSGAQQEMSREHFIPRFTGI